MRANECHKYEMLARDRYRMSAVRVVGMCQHHTTRGLHVVHEYYEYERWYVSGSYIARTVCAQMSTASTGWWHVLASYSARAA
jgi:hypothetical protein